MKNIKVGDYVKIVSGRCFGGYDSKLFVLETVESINSEPSLIVTLLDLDSKEKGFISYDGKNLIKVSKDAVKIGDKIRVGAKTFQGFYVDVTFTVSKLEEYWFFVEELPQDIRHIFEYSKEGFSWEKVE